MSIARQLNLITEWPEDQLAEQEWRKQLFAGTTFHNCYVGIGKVWQVKLFLGHEQRLLGESKYGWRACRFADMAIVHFYKYRSRRHRPLVNADLNFSIASAKRDLESVPAAVSMLVAWEKSLLDKGLIREYASSEPATLVIRDRRTRTQVRKDIQIKWSDLKSSIAHAEQLLAHDETACNQIMSLREHLAQTQKYLTSFDSLLTSAPSAIPSAQAERVVIAEAELKKARVESLKPTPEQRAAEAAVDKCDYMGCVPE